jgi:hypothetical protein
MIENQYINIGLRSVSRIHTLIREIARTYQQTCLELMDLANDPLFHAAADPDREFSTLEALGALSLLEHLDYKIIDAEQKVQRTLEEFKNRNR